MGREPVLFSFPSTIPFLLGSAYGIGIVHFLETFGVFSVCITYMAIGALGEQVLAYCQAYLPHSDFRHPVPRWTGDSSFRIQVQLEWVQLSVSDLVDILCMSSFQCQKLKENCAKKNIFTVLAI